MQYQKIKTSAHTSSHRFLCYEIKQHDLRGMIPLIITGFRVKRENGIKSNRAEILDLCQYYTRCMLRISACAFIVGFRPSGLESGLCWQAGYVDICFFTLTAKIPVQETGMTMKCMIH